MKIILIVGPSGAGKDSLLKAGRQVLAERDDLLFVPRYVTRMPDDNEQNYYVDSLAFAMLKQNGFFFIDWQAHGNFYGISLEPLLKKDGRAVIISVSRTVIAAFEKVFDDVDTIAVSAPEPVLRQRLADRRREPQAFRDSRLARADLEVRAARLHPFDNDGPLEDTAPRFVRLLQHILSAPPGSQSAGEIDPRADAANSESFSGGT